MRVLVLEDSDLVRSTMHELLTGRGFEVFSYPDPTSCPLHRAGHCQCTAAEVCADVIVTDLDMPHMSGLEFVEELVRKGCKIPHRAILSGSLNEAARVRAADLQCEIFAKPEGTLALLQWLDEVAASLQPVRRLAPCLP